MRIVVTLTSVALLTVLFILGVVQAEDGKAPAPPEKKEAAKVEKKEPVEQKTESGLRYWVLKPGKGARPRPGDDVSVHYVGRFTDGRVFDSSQRQTNGFTFKLGTGGVIPGWDEGVALMRVGARYRFHIPWKLAYGEKGGRGIPPKADLVFEIELLAIKEGTPLPEFRKGDPEKQEKTESGIVYEVLKAGSGEPPRKDQGVRMKFAVWSNDGKYALSTAATNFHLAGMRDDVALGRFPLKFLPEAIRMMKPGTHLRLEVPAGLCFGDRRALPNIEPGAVSVWELEMISVQDVPKFRQLDAAKTKETATGLKYEVIRSGEGTRKPGPRNTVEVRYSGWTPQGVMFDSSHARGDTATFSLGGVIPGWTEGLQLMNEGGICLFWIPAPLAYGNRPPPGAGPIKPGMDLIFLVELVRVVK